MIYLLIRNKSIRLLDNLIIVYGLLVTIVT